MGFIHVNGISNCNRKKWQHKLIGVQLGTLHKHCHQEVTSIIVVEQEDFPFHFLRIHSIPK